MKPMRPANSTAVKKTLTPLLAILLMLLCASAPACAACLGDVNEDSTVDGQDISTIANQFGIACPSPETCTADTDNDNDVDDADLQQVAIELGRTSCTSAFAGTYIGRYEGTWMGIDDSGDLQIIIDSSGSVTVKSQGHIGFGSAPGTPINPPEGDLNTLIENWATVDDQGVITVIGLGPGETATATVAGGIIQGFWNAPNGDNCTFNANDGTNTAPVAQITSPAEGAIYIAGDQVLFTGSGTDNEDGALNGASLAWRSDVEGPIGTGETFASNTLSVGTHHITLEITDSQGAVDTSTITISIVTNGSGTWTKIYGQFGERMDDYINSVQQTNDGGFIFAGSTADPTTGQNLWLFKTDNNGDELWSRAFAGLDAVSVQQTADGGFILSGSGFSDSGDSDILLIKTDSDGLELWRQTYGGSGYDSASTVQLTSDGGYVVAGGTDSYGSGRSDFWVLKTDALGNEIWNRTYGGIGDEKAKSIHQTNDGGYIIAGYTGSYGAGDLDGYVVRTDSAGNEIWDRAYGTVSGDYIYSIKQTDDGSYIFAGQTGCSPIDFMGSGWLVKTNGTGNVLWENAYTIGEYDEINSVQETGDGGYILAGMTSSSGANSVNDGLVIKTDVDGNTLWMNTYGWATSHDSIDDIKPTSDGGYILAGYTTINGTTDTNGLIVKTDSSGN